MASRGERIIGVISDTHGMLRDAAVSSLAGCELIVHAGDVGGRAILDVLARIAPVVAVRGNMDGGRWAASLPDSEVVEVDGKLLYVVHDPYEVDLDPREAGFDAVITGHTHRAAIETRYGVLHVNPGSAGPRRTSRPATLAIVRVSLTGLDAAIVELEE